MKDKEMIEFLTGEFGKPFINKNSKLFEKINKNKNKNKNNNLQFNITDELDLISISINFNNNLDIGIDLANPYDIEKTIIDNNLIKDLNKFHNEFFKDIFTNFEKLQLDKFNNNNTIDNNNNDNNNIKYLNYAHYWSIKESYSKYLGVGLSNGLQYEFLNFKKFQDYKNGKNIIHMHDHNNEKDKEIETFELIEDVDSLNDFFQDKSIGTSRVLIETDREMPMVLCVTHEYNSCKINKDEGIHKSDSISDTIHSDEDEDHSPVQVKYIKINLEQMVDYLVNISASPSVPSSSSSSSSPSD
ncbi:unnamed protein product [[Candida] boidinii]|uniref:Unnamed protein product n=1 Tax=Candida boidinii TaxID=5477 RepID=A0ACB5TJJ4_CANBO|nr:unnamed protein product [[Candida] boidinii]GME92562.1 unnamed protein product [[Candida] boidinii]